LTFSNNGDIIMSSTMPSTIPSPYILLDSDCGVRKVSTPGFWLQP